MLSCAQQHLRQQRQQRPHPYPRRPRRERDPWPGQPQPAQHPPQPQPARQAPQFQYPQITIQSSGPVRVVIAADAQAGLHVPPESTVVVVPARVFETAGRNPTPVQGPVGRPAQAPAGRPAWRPVGRPGKAPTLRGTDADIRVRVDFGASEEPTGSDADVRVRVDFGEPEGPAGPDAERATRRPRRTPKTGRATWRRREPARGAPEYAAAVAQLDDELDAYMAAGRRAPGAPPPAEAPPSPAGEEDYAAMVDSL